MRILVMADTHDVLRPDVKEQIRLADAVIHAGDVSTEKIANEIRAQMREDAPLYLVRGNADKDAFGESLEETLKFELEGVAFFVIHNRKEISADLSDRQIIIFGHSHKYLQEERDGKLWLNPGSCGRRRFGQEVSMAMLTVTDGKWSAEKIVLEPEVALKVDAKSDREELSGGELLKIISGILSRMNKGWSVNKIAADMKLDGNFVEEICRIHVTHPGVDANGILDKLEVNRQVSPKKQDNK